MVCFERVMDYFNSLYFCGFVDGALLFVLCLDLGLFMASLNMSLS